MSGARPLPRPYGRRAVRRSGAVEQALMEARSETAAAEALLAGMPESTEREALFEAARYIVDRTI